MPTCYICKANKVHFCVLHESPAVPGLTRAGSNAPAHSVCSDCVTGIRGGLCPECQTPIVHNDVYPINVSASHNGEGCSQILFRNCGTRLGVRVQFCTRQCGDPFCADHQQGRYIDEPEVPEAAMGPHEQPEQPEHMVVDASMGGPHAVDNDWHGFLRDVRQVSREDQITMVVVNHASQVIRNTQAQNHRVREIAIAYSNDLTQRHERSRLAEIVMRNARQDLAERQLPLTAVLQNAQLPLSPIIEPLSDADMDLLAQHLWESW